MTHYPEPLLSPQANKPKVLKQLLASGKTLAVPGAFNAICAKIIESVGFAAVYISGAGLNNGVAGYPDIGMLTATEMATLAGYTARAVNIPAIADADTGFGEPMNVFRTVQLYEQAGLSGLHIEDQVFPKRCGHLDGKQVIATEAMVQKISAAVAARQNPDFLLIARVDSRAVHGFDDTLARARHYLDAGADMIFPEALADESEFRRFAAELRTSHPQGLLLANMTEFGKTPMMPLSLFEAMGYHLVIYPMTAFRVMQHAVEAAMQALKASGTQAGLLDTMTPRAILYEQIHYDAYTDLDSSLGSGYNKPSGI